MNQNPNTATESTTPRESGAATDAAINPDFDDVLDYETDEDEAPVPTLEEAREREQAAYRRYLSEGQEDPADYLEARSEREYLEELAASAAAAGTNGPDVRDVTSAYQERCLTCEDIGGNPGCTVCAPPPD